MGTEAGSLKHWSPTFLAPGTGCVEDSFSTKGSGETGGGAQALKWVRFPSTPSRCSASAHLLLRSQVPQATDLTCLCPRVWRLLIWSTIELRKRAYFKLIECPLFLLLLKMALDSHIQSDFVVTETLSTHIWAG